MNVNAVLNHAGQLWPQANFTDAETSAWRKSLEHINVETEQAIAVLDAVRVDRGRRRPPIHAINDRLRVIVENEARARVIGKAASPVASLDFSRPQGFVVDAIRLWREDPSHARFSDWRHRAKKAKLVEVMRRNWAQWTGDEGPYAASEYENDKARPVAANG